MIWSTTQEKEIHTKKCLFLDHTGIIEENVNEKKEKKKKERKKKWKAIKETYFVIMLIRLKSSLTRSHELEVILCKWEKSEKKKNDLSKV